MNRLTLRASAGAGLLGFMGLIGLIGAGTGSRGAAAEPAKTAVVLASMGGMDHPHALAVGTNGPVYVSVGGPAGKGIGAVLRVTVGKDGAFGNSSPLLLGLEAPRGLATYQTFVFVADRDKVWKVEQDGKAMPFAPAHAFPTSPVALHGLTVDPETGVLYVSDAGDLDHPTGAIYRVTPLGRVELVTNTARWPALRSPTGLALDGASHLLVVDAGAGTLSRVKLADGTAETLLDGLAGIDDVCWDNFGRLFLSDRMNGRVLGLAKLGDRPVVVADGFQRLAAVKADEAGNLIVADSAGNSIRRLRVSIPGHEVDDSPLNLETALAFPEMQWAGWEAETDKGKLNSFRPIALTNAGDGSNRIFVATEHGVIYVIPNDQKANTSQVFLDISGRVKYDDAENEEGFLGLAFHPDYKSNGEFFVFYTPKNRKRTNVVSRFRVSKDDPNRADPASEEEVLAVENRPFWNHDGGTICFGPDGHLYIALGDGGAANDLYDNGQNLNTLLGKILRLDVNRKDPGRGYAVPKDNPFVGRKDARPEVWAYGLRNVWRMAFDRTTGLLYASDVGQNLWEEIDLIRKGGNYGWNRREGRHPFGARGAGARADLVDPIWEYSHDVGKSLTGGVVYRGKKFPDLDGCFLYADYVTGKIWALKYDEAKQRVVSNRPIKDRAAPIMSFGEDETGEVYLMTYSPTGQGIYRLTGK